MDKDYENFVQRMGSFDMDFDLDKEEEEKQLKHHGVKGMKWGVRRYQPYPKGSKHAGKFLNLDKQPKVTKDSGFKEIAKANIRSKSREASLVKAQREIQKLSTEQANKVVSRATLENRLKVLSNTKNVGTEQSKRDYLNRSSMSDEELKRKVDRLQVSNNMRIQAKNANKDSIELGKTVISIAAPLAVQLVTQNAIDTNWLDRKLNPMPNPKDWDAIGKQASKSLDDLI